VLWGTFYDNEKLLMLEFGIVSYARHECYEALGLP
jgi:hypothetical protein